MAPLLTTILHRPYVFAFLAAYLFLAWRRWGWPRTLLWLVSGYAIAWASEVSSIANGFPYGEYHYVYENLAGELLVAGVPFFDSLSYAFLTFSGFTMGEHILRRDHGPWTMDHGLKPSGAGQWSMVNGQWSEVFLGALLTMLLDVIIDPIATMGDKWFLGQIHWYAHPGWYFGVPLTNFGGWFLVAFVIIGFNALLWKLFPSLLPMRADHRPWTMDHGPEKAGAGQWSMVNGRWSQWPFPAFYTAIALFSIVISFWVGEWKLGLASSAILAAIFLAVAYAGRSRV